MGNEPELNIEYLREKESTYRKMSAQYMNMHYAAKGAADSIMMMLGELEDAATKAGEAQAQASAGENSHGDR